jgi:hypothetical protein
MTMCHHSTADFDESWAVIEWFHMTAASRASDVASVDEWLLASKRLVGGHPSWRDGFSTERQAIWLIEESNGVRRAQLRFRVPLRHRTSPSISVLFRDRVIWRLDLVDGVVVKYNPPSAEALGLPAIVRSTHEHRWDDNRDHILGGAPWGQLPNRRPCAVQLRRLPQALPALAANINLTILPENRDFDVPPPTDLFGV